MTTKLSKGHEIHLDAHGIVNIKVIEGAHLNVAILCRLNKNVQKLAGQKRILALIDARRFHTFTPEATSYLKKEIVDKTRIATAVVGNKVAVRLMVDNMTKVQKTKSPIRMFTSEVQARTWLLSVKNKAAKE
jgi:hypothetical protein